MKLVIGLLIALAIFFLAFNNWKTAVKVVFFLTVAEGALRKWVLPQASELIYFLKDFVLLGAYIKFYGTVGIRGKFKIINHPLTVLIILVFIWCFVQALNPSLGTFIVGIFGLKTYLFYIPLIWMLPTLFPSEESLYKFLRSHLLLIIPVGILGIVQFFSPINSPINSYAPTSAGVTEVATFGGATSQTMSLVRITGSFSYINNYTAYLVVCFGLLIALLSIHQPRKWKLLLMIQISLVVVNSLMTGSRTPIIASAVILVGYLAIRGVTKISSTLRLIQQFILPVIAVIFVAYIGFNSAMNAFIARASGNNDLLYRISISFLEPLNFIQYKDVDGFGVGATHPGSIALRSILNLPPGEFIPVGYESEMGRVILEIGPIGFFLWYSLRLVILGSLFIVFLNLRRPLLRQLALVAFLIQLSWINGQLVFHHTFSVYYWFMTGFVFLLPWLEYKENFYRQQQILRQNAEFQDLTSTSDG
ncbi:hypothetical protein NIES2119_02020 [[Phormidium ambiguum] IAM M-71]|uniref:Oligosaccharide repeat unit polymerase n=1 Tax=[Phormidium ambiguum] IAM M-71 TaxID=454136 RepID=A0A1U7ISM4_9CYAN|nr:hypothetical protein [Phormidium ambiguum]OKH40422.1 hypothetical protein NIES2119_02020 [Phormidium ambiguum IAM M-71]